MTKIKYLNEEEEGEENWVLNYFNIYATHKKSNECKII